MYSYFLEILALLKYPLIGLFLIFLTLSFFWIPIFNFFKLKNYHNFQRVHKGEVARMGGIAIYFFYWAIYLFDIINDQIFLNILVSTIPLIFISIKEDLFHNTTPKIRLIFMIISCLIFFYINPIIFPIIDNSHIGNIISSYPVSIIFFTFSIMVIINGMNLIDGMNGLFGFTAVIQLFTLISLAIFYQDDEILKLSIIFVAPLILFLPFNFPFGKIFIGDSGAYFFGFTNALLIINFFGIYEDALSWIAILIVFYPSLELLFSFFRKIKKQQSPLDPDNKHLHTLIYKKFLEKFSNQTLSNSTTTLALMIFWLSPFIIYNYFNINFYFIILSISLLTLLYLIIYNLVMKDD
jgi:UDP-GlcNAc:undecaprenyl-phosphate/decaprenyl-phosphate GlcNAc-1-phosphate transferase